MTKTKKPLKTTKQKPQSWISSFELENIIPTKYLTLSAVLSLIALFLYFYAPILFYGKTFQSGDLIAGKAIQKITEITKGKGMLWNPFIFCGLPSQFSGVGYDRWFDIISTAYVQLRVLIGKIFHAEYAQHIAYLFVFGMNAFVFMRDRKAGVLNSLFVAIAAAFSTGIVVFLSIGHITKLDTISMIPLVFMILLRMQEKIRLIDVVLCTIALNFMLYGWHAQVIFYAFFSIGLFFLFFLIRYLMQKNYIALKKLLTSAVIFAALSILAVGTMVDTYAQMYEYTPYSTRGTKSITELEAPSKEKTDSDFYEYATNWSFSPGEVLTFIVPSFYGFGNVMYNGPQTNNQDVEVNTYFGQMMFVDVAMYMGVIVFFLAVFAMIVLRKDPLVQFFTFLVVLSLLISFGRNFSVIYDLMFYYFPMFDKFRVPSMILVIPQTFFPLLAGLGLLKIIQLRKEGETFGVNMIKYFSYGASGLLIISVLLNSVLSNWFMQRLSESTRGQQLQPIADFMAGMFVSDTVIAFAIVSATFWLAYAYLKGKVSADVLTFVIIVFTVFDLFRISSRGMQFSQSQDVSDQFTQPEYITTIDKQNDTQPYRLINLKQDKSLGSYSQNSNFNMYFQKQDLAGYSGIKPRTYQDYIDVVNPANPTLWRMLNVKYIVLEKAVQFPGLVNISPNGKDHVYLNTNVLPRVYFVNKTEVKTPLEILKEVRDNQFDPKELAFTEKSLKIDQPDSSANAKILKYNFDSILIEANASGNNLLFLGDTYYPKGWTATIDGKETEIYRVNYGFRGIVVPKGKHTVEFMYLPKSYTIGKTISLTINILVLLGLFASIFLYVKEKKVKPANIA